MRKPSHRFPLAGLPRRLPALLAGSTLILSACGGGDPQPVSQVPQVPLDSELVADGQAVFRYDTFGDETFWTDTLKMNEVIEQYVDPLTAATVGLKIDVSALPADVVSGVLGGEIPLDDPQTTLALLD